MSVCVKVRTSDERPPYDTKRTLTSPITATNSVGHKVHGIVSFISIALIPAVTNGDPIATSWTLYARVKLGDKMLVVARPADIKP